MGACASSAPGKDFSRVDRVLSTAAGVATGGDESMAVIEDCDEIVKEFLVESYENLDQLDRNLVELEQDPSNREILASIFRTIHTIKGTCGFLGFEKLEKVAHVGENLLSKLRDGKLALDAERTSALLSMIDAIREMLASIEEHGKEGAADYSTLLERLTLLQQETVEATPTPAPATSETTTQAAAPTTPDPAGTPQGPGPSEASPTPDKPKPPIAEQDTRRPDPPPKASPAQQTPSATGGKHLSESTIRVDVEHLDKLMNLVGELVLARNQILQFVSGQENAAFISTSQRLNLITTELQEGVMKTRMQPIGNVWNKLPRVVRDLARSCEKQVRVVMEGKETELDKTIIEAIRDPLTHLVRNSVDHGIETPALRRERGKDEEGTLLLRAFHEGGQVNIEIIDDGAGIDTEILKAKALEKGVITPDQAARMGERELLFLIFAPGFSTAKKVTKVSGRGVGMDVVRMNIEKIGGSIDLQSQRGVGTTIRIKIPLTLAIIPALIVSSKGERFAIPQVNLLELVRLERDQIGTKIERIHGTPVYRLRGNLLPLVSLDEALSLADEHSQDEEDGAAAVSIVVLQTDEHPFGLIVSEINDTEEIVVKPLGKQIKELGSYAGATIMGDGRVALILDVVGLSKRAGVLGDLSEERFANKHEPSMSGLGERQTLLVFSVGSERRMALPLELVARLEEFSAEAVETSGSDMVVQYRGEIMPLIELAGVFGLERSHRERLPVVVFVDEGRSVGLIVEEILDIVDEHIDVRKEANDHAGLLGAAVIQGKVTELLDVKGVVRTSISEAKAPPPSAACLTSEGRR